MCIDVAFFLLGAMHRALLDAVEFVFVSISSFFPAVRHEAWAVLKCRQFDVYAKSQTEHRLHTPRTWSEMAKKVIVSRLGLNKVILRWCVNDRISFVWMFSFCFLFFLVHVQHKYKGRRMPLNLPSKSLTQMIFPRHKTLMHNVRTHIHLITFGSFVVY